LYFQWLVSIEHFQFIGIFCYIIQSSLQKKLFQLELNPFNLVGKEKQVGCMSLTGFGPRE